MDSLFGVCLQEIALEGLDGITLETFWMRLRTCVDPVFPLALDDNSKSLIWQYVAESDELEFFELPEPRDMPLMRDVVEGTNPVTGATTVTKHNEMKLNKEIYPVAYVCDEKKGVRGSCATYYQRKDVTDDVRTKDGNGKITLMEAVERWGNLLVVVASQELRWRNMVGLNGDPVTEIKEKQYVMLEIICRGRHLGEWQWRLARLMREGSKTLYYMRKLMAKRGFIKKRIATYQVDDRPHQRVVVLFGFSFKERIAMPMYERIWKAISDILVTKTNKTWTQIGVRHTIRDQFSDMTISDKIFKRIVASAVTAKMIVKLRLPYEEVFHEKKKSKNGVESNAEISVLQLKKTYEEYLEEENIEEEDDEEDKIVESDPKQNFMVAERNFRCQVVDLIVHNQELGECTPARVVTQSLMIDYYMSRHMLRKLQNDKIISKIMLDEGRQRTSGYCMVESVAEMEQVIKQKQRLEGQKNLLKEGTPTTTPVHSRPATPSIEHPSTSSSPHSEGSPGIFVKKEFSSKLSDVGPGLSEVKCSSELTSNYLKRTSNYLRRRKFILDFMESNKVVDNIYPITKALRQEERQEGSSITCDSKTIKRMVKTLCTENLLQTISTVVMSDDGLHTKTVDLISLYGLSPFDSLISSALQVAKFRFFGSSSESKKKVKYGTTAPLFTETPSGKSAAGTPTPSRKENKSPARKKKQSDKSKSDDDKEKKSSSDKPKKSHKHKHKDKTDKTSKESSKPEIPHRPQSATEPKFRSRKYYYRQLGYMPKMLRMRTAHLFVWYLIHGTNKSAIKTETLDDLDKMTNSDAPSKTGSGGSGGANAGEKNTEADTGNNAEKVSGATAEGAPLPVIPISIRKINEKGIEDQLSELLETSREKGAESLTGQQQGTIMDASDGDASKNTPATLSPMSRNNPTITRHGIQVHNVNESPPQSEPHIVYKELNGLHQLQQRLVHDQPSSVTDQSEVEIIQTSQSEAANDSTSQSAEQPDSTPTEAADVTLVDGEKHFPVYSDTKDWRRYITPLQPNAKRPSGWCEMRDFVLAMPLSVYLKLVSLPFEVKGIKEYLNHPLKQHILLRNIPADIRRTLLRGRTYLFQLESVLIKLAAIGMVVLANKFNLEKELLSIYVCKRVSILDTTTSKPHTRKISDEQRYLRRFYQLNKLQSVEDYWFDLQCICLDTPLGFMKGKFQEKKVERHDYYIKSIATIVRDMHSSFDINGIAPGDGRGAGGLDSCFFAHLRRNWNWFHAAPEVNLERYTATWPKQGPFAETNKDDATKAGKSPKVKRLGSIQYRRSNMSKGTSVEVVSVSKKHHKEMKAAVKRKRHVEDGSPPPAKAKKQTPTEKNKDAKEMKKDAKKKDTAIARQLDERRKIRKPWNANGKRNTRTYDDVDEDARNKMVKMRVDWSPDEDSMILLFRVASTLLNAKAKTLGAFVPWFVIRDIMHKHVKRSVDKTTNSVSKRSSLMFKNECTVLNYKICMAEAQTDKELKDWLDQLSIDYTDIKECANKYETLVLKLQTKFQNSEKTTGALTDLRDLRNYAITTIHKPVGCQGDAILAQRDVKNDNDIHCKLLHSVILSSLSSRDSLLYNNQLLYRFYHQYNEELLGSAFFNLKKLGFCNRNRKQKKIPQLKRVIPLAPISTQLSITYKERFCTKIHEDIIKEMSAFLEKIPPTTDDSLALQTESVGGDCAGFLSLYSSNMITADITLPDQIIVLDTNLMKLGDNEPDSDSDDDMEGVGAGQNSVAGKKHSPDIQDLLRIQEERNRRVMEQQKIVQQQTKPAVSAQELPDAIASDNDAILPAIVQTEHSYSLSQKGITLGQTGETVSQQGHDGVATDVVSYATDIVSDVSKQQGAVNRTEHIGVPANSTTAILSGDTRIAVMCGETSTASLSGDTRTAIVGEDTSMATASGETSTATVSGETSTATASGEASTAITSGDSTATVGNDTRTTTTTSDGSEKIPPLNTGYNLQSVSISHSRWLLLQGHFEPGIIPLAPGKNIQDNTWVNACTITIQRKPCPLQNVAGSMTRDVELLPLERISGAQDRIRRTLLWDYLRHDDGEFVGFATPCVKNKSEVFQRDNLVTTKWSDIGAMIQGLEFGWSRKNTYAMMSVYNLIDKANVLGVSCKDLITQSNDIMPSSESSVKFRDYLQVLVDEKLVLEVGFDVLRLVATKNASQWLVHSIRLTSEKVKPSSTSSTEDASISQASETSSSSGPSAKRQRTEQSVYDDADDCIIILSDVEEEEVQEISTEKKRKRETSKRSKGKLDLDVDELDDTICIEGHGDPVVFLGRPWCSIEGYQSDSQLREYLKHVLLLINSHPAIYEHAVYQHFKDVLYPMECLELLKMLSELGCITKHVLYRNKPTTPFIAQRQQDMTKPVYYYQPTLDGLVRLAECNTNKS